LRLKRHGQLGVLRSGAYAHVFGPDFAAALQDRHSMLSDGYRSQLDAATRARGSSRLSVDLHVDTGRNVFYDNASVGGITPQQYGDRRCRPRHDGDTNERRHKPEAARRWCTFRLCPARLASIG
jgi:hypothetical protein